MHVVAAADENTFIQLLTSECRRLCELPFTAGKWHSSFVVLAHDLELSLFTRLAVEAREKGLRRDLIHPFDPDKAVDVMYHTDTLVVAW